MKNTKYKIALCQLTPGYNQEENIKKAEVMLQSAAQKNARIAVLPEIFHYPYELDKIPNLPDYGDKIREKMQKAARDNNLYLCTGTIAEKTEASLFNTSYLIDPGGKIILKYRKRKLFKADFNNIKVDEGKTFERGGSAPIAETEFGNIAIAVCFDIRYPEIAADYKQRGTDLLLVPAAFTAKTGNAHWHTLFKARAIDNQFFTAAVSPGKNPESSYQVFGHSLVSNPWGDILTEAGVKEEIRCCDIDTSLIEETEKRILLKQGV